MSKTKARVARRKLPFAKSAGRAGRFGKVSKPEALTVPAKYLFIDVVGFTRDRSVEAQSEIVGILNAVVRESLAKLRINQESTVLLPTGDGMCIGLLNLETPYDIHILLALEILRSVAKRNAATKDRMRQFEIRVGVNANTDNLVVDINGERNLAGSGINTAQRVMSTADAGQIMVSQVVYETLNSREKYMGAFRSYFSLVKHGVGLQVHQFVQTRHQGLSVDIPSLFQAKDRDSKPKLTARVAYYLAHAIRLRQFVLKGANNSNAAPVTALMLWLFAEDSVAKSEATEVDPHRSYIYRKGAAGSQETFEYYSKADIYILLMLSRFIKRELAPYGDCFEYSLFHDVHFVSDAGRQKLKTEFPEIWSELKLEEGSAPNSEASGNRADEVGSGDKGTTER